MGGQLVEFAEKWWADHVIQGLPIEADGSEAYDKFLRRRYPTSTAGVLEAKPGHFDLVEAVRAAKAALKITEEVEADAVAKLKAAIGEAEGIAGLCTWKNNKGSPKTDWEQVAKQLHAPADLIAKFTTNRPGARVLRLTREK
jgi:predicted phage-related endonuclease